ncbi:MAG: hypothetical protein KC496_03100, partial [Anaerolineae bacterium]|nr:hypothetical protein [Anaerolineae bacterium]
VQATGGDFAAFSIEVEHQALQVIHSHDTARKQADDVIAHELDELYASVRRGHLHGVEPKIKQLLQQINQSQQLYRYQSMIHSVYGIYHMKRGDYAAADAEYHRGLGYARGLERAVILANLGSATFYDGRFADAQEHYKQSSHLAKRAKAPLIQAFTTTSMGTVSAERGQYAAAEGFYKDAHKLAQEIQHQERLAYVYMNRGALAYYEGHFALADRLYVEALKHAAELDHAELLSQTNWYLGVLKGSLGDIKMRQAQFDLAREIAHHDDLIWQVVGTLVEEGRYWLLDHQWDKATEQLLVALETATHYFQKDHILRSLVYLSVALAYQSSGNQYVDANHLLTALWQHIPRKTWNQL